MSRSTAKILSIVCAVVAVVIACLFIPSGNKAASMIVFLIYIPIGVYLNYCQRCRHCGRWPRKGDFWDEYCPHCGEKLDD